MSIRVVRSALPPRSLSLSPFFSLCLTRCLSRCLSLCLSMCLALTSTSILVLAATPATAADETGSDETDTPLEELLIEKGFITAEELEAARREAAAAAPPEEAPSVFEAEPVEEPKVKVSAGSSGLVVESPDGDFVFKFGGRLQYDFGGFTGGGPPLGDGTELRRGRIKSEGTLWSDWDFKLEVNFDTNGDVTVTDGWLRYSGWSPFTITVGNQKVPFSQQSMSSSNWQVFQERGLPDALIDSSEEGRRRVGVVLQSYGDAWNLAAGVFGEGVSTAGNGNNEDWGTASRLVLFPFSGEKRLLTIGGSIYYRQFESISSLRYRSKPEANLADYRLIDTGLLPGNPAFTNLFNATDDLSYNIESTAVFGPLHAQGEYTAARVDRYLMDSVKFAGWYVQAGFFITGESRNYDKKSAQFKAITPKNAYGAWEIAARWSELDLQTKDILGGEESELTIGLNWWVNKNVMFRFNYVRAWVDPSSTYLVVTVPPPASAILGPTTTLYGGQTFEVNAFMGRAQVVF